MILIFMVEGARAVNSFLHSVGNTREHGGSSREHNITIEILSDINVAFHDRVVGGLVDSSSFHTQEGGLEECLRASESLVSDGDDLSVRKFIGLFQSGGGGSGLHFLFEVKSNVAELFLDISDNFSFGGGGEGVTSFGQDFHQVISQVASGKIETENGVGKSITFVNWDTVSNTITRVHNDTSGSSRGIEGEYGLNGDVHGGSVEGLEHDLGHLFSVGLGIQRSFSEKNRVFLRSYSQFIVEGVMPDLLHIVPVGDNTVFNGIFQSQNTSLGLSFVSNIGILLAHTDHYSSMSGSSNDGREHSSGCIITGKARLTHSRAVIYHERLNLFGHYCKVFRYTE